MNIRREYRVDRIRTAQWGATAWQLDLDPDWAQEIVEHFHAGTAAAYSEAATALAADLRELEDRAHRIADLLREDHERRGWLDWWPPRSRPYFTGHSRGFKAEPARTAPSRGLSVASLDLHLKREFGTFKAASSTSPSRPSRSQFSPSRWTVVETEKKARVTGTGVIDSQLFLLEGEAGEAATDAEHAWSAALTVAEPAGDAAVESERSVALLVG